MPKEVPGAPQTASRGMKKTMQGLRDIAISGFISKIWIPRNLFTHVDFAEGKKN